MVYQNTLLIDVNQGQNPYTKSYLERRIGVDATQQTIEGIPTSETADFVIILGQDEAGN